MVVGRLSRQWRHVRVLFKVNLLQGGRDQADSAMIREASFNSYYKEPHKHSLREGGASLGVPLGKKT